MKSFYATFLLVGFLGIAVFGFMAMDHADSLGHVRCIAVMVRGAACLETGALSFAAFHLNTFKSFSTATFGENLFGSFLLLAFLVMRGAFSALSRNGSGLSVFSSRNTASPESFFPFLQKRDLLRWLALHEVSPAAV